MDDGTDNYPTDINLNQVTARNAYIYCVIRPNPQLPVTGNT